MPVFAKTETRIDGPIDVLADPLAVYVHWPFCLSKCPYCDFNSHVRADVDHGRWRRALLAELAHFRELTGPRPVTSVFFGGGTPSLMEPETVAAVIRAVDDLWGLEDGAEITLEANPTSVEAARFRDFRAAGVNRASIGVQSFDNRALGMLGREHGADEARRAITLARATFERISFDLIYARPNQTVAQWRAELDEAIGRAADHLSLYQLTIEPGTAFAGLHARGRLPMPDDDHAAHLYEVTQDVCGRAGLPAYEVSNHARPGAESRHNLTYWRYGDYVGAGPGAHGRLTVGGNAQATVQHRKPEAWLKAVEGAGHGTTEEAALVQHDRAAEMILMGLRLTEGIDAGSFERRIGAPLERFIDRAALAHMIELDLVEDISPPAILKVTAGGRAVLNSVIARLVI